MSRRSRSAASRRLQSPAEARALPQVTGTQPLLGPGGVIPPAMQPAPSAPTSTLTAAQLKGLVGGANVAGTNSTPADYYRQPPLPVGARPGPVTFPPGDPLRPAPGLDDGTGGPRAWSYPASLNVAPVPRMSELYSFAQLRGLAECYEGVQLCEEVIFRILDRIELQVVPDPDYLDAGEDETAEKWTTPARQMREWLMAPWRNLDLHQWMRAVMRELLELDAVGIFHERTRGGQLAGLRFIAGDTLAALGDVVGATPLPPAPAYLQVIHGAPAGLYTRDELDYLRFNTRANSLYGRPPTEEIIFRVNLALRKENWDLTHYTDGATPEGVLETDQAEFINSSADDVAQFERMFNAVLAGNDQLRVRVKTVPPGWHYKPTKVGDLVTGLDEFLLGITVAAFGLSREELGFTATSNRSTGQQQEDVIYRNAVRPKTDFLARYLTRSVIRRYHGLAIAPGAATISRAATPTKPAKGVWDNRFVVAWRGVEEPEDWNQKAFALNALTKSGIVSPTQVQQLLKLPRKKGDPTIPAYVLAPAGPDSVVFLPDLVDQRDAIRTSHQAQLDAKTQTAQQQAALGANQQALSDQQVEMGKVNVATAKLQHAHLKQQLTQPPTPPQPPPNGPPNGPNPPGSSGGGAGSPPSGGPSGGGADSSGGSSVAPSTPGGATPRQPPGQGRQGGAPGAGAAPHPPATPAAQNRVLEAQDGQADRWADDPSSTRGDNDDAFGHDLEPRRGARDPRGGDGPGGRAVGDGIRHNLGAGDGDGDAPDGRVSTGDGIGVASTGTRPGRGERASDASGPASPASTGTSGTGIASRGAGSDRSGSGGAGSGPASSASGTGTANSSGRDELRDEYRLWRDKALKAVKRGARPPAFVAYAIPAGEAAWITDTLAQASTPDGVRAVFEEARTRFAASRAAADALAADEVEEHTGIMVAIMLPPDVAAPLHDAFAQAIQHHPRRAEIHPLPVGEMHVTLAYLGNTTDEGWNTRQQRLLGRIVDDFAADQQPIDLRLGGVARFHNEGKAGHELDAVYVPVTSAALHRLRTALVATLTARGVPVDMTFPDYTPHVTLAYLPPDLPTPTVRAPQGVISVDGLTVAIGGQQTTYPLGAEQNGNALEDMGRAATTDPLADLAAALLQRLGDLPAQAAQAAVIEQVRDLRAQVAEALRAS